MRTRQKVITVVLIILALAGLVACTTGTGSPGGTPVAGGTPTIGGPGQAEGGEAGLEIAEPAAGTVVTDSVTVRGRGQGIETAIQVSLEVEGVVLAREVSNVSSGAGRSGDFSATLQVPSVSSESEAVIKIYTLSPVDGSVQYLEEVPVKLAPRSVPGNVLATTPTIRLSPDHGPGGTYVNVLGEGFPAGERIEIRLSGTASGAAEELYAVTHAGAHGEIDVWFVMPEAWPNGTPITQSEIVVLAATPDYLKKATATFAYESSP